MTADPFSQFISSISISWSLRNDRSVHSRMQQPCHHPSNALHKRCKSDIIQEDNQKQQDVQQGHPYTRKTSTCNSNHAFVHQHSRHFCPIRSTTFHEPILGSRKCVPSIRYISTRKCPSGKFFAMKMSQRSSPTTTTSPRVPSA